MNSTIKKILMYVLFLGIAALLLWLTYKDEDLGKLWYDISHAKPLPIVASFVMGYLAIVSRGIRWNIMLEPMGYTPSKWNSISSVASGYFANSLLPRSGELVRCGALNQTEGVPVDKLIGTVISERVVDFIMLFIFMFLGIAFNLDSVYKFIAEAFGAEQVDEGSGLMNLALFGGGFVVLLVVLWMIFKSKIKALSFYEKVRTFLIGIVEGVKSVFAMKKKGWFIFHTAFIWLMYFLMAYVVAFALEGLEMGVMEGVFIVVAGGVGMIIPAPGGTGSYQYCIKLGFIALGFSEAYGVQFGTIVWTTQTSMILITGGIGSYVIKRAIKKRKAAGDGVVSG